MSHHPNPLAYGKPITLDTLPDLFAHHRARFGGWTMTNTPPENEPPAPERPDDVPEETWNALGDPGKQALSREREARQAAERALAAARAKPTPPKPKDPAKPDPKPADPPKPKDGDQPDFAALIKQAVSEAVKPFAEAEERRQTETAAERVRSAVLDAAKARLHDATDALTNVDLAGVVNDQGQADEAKIKTALDDLVTRKPHLAKTTERIAPPGIGGGGPANATEGEKVKAALAEMQRATGARPATSTTN